MEVRELFENKAQTLPRDLQHRHLLWLRELRQKFRFEWQVDQPRHSDDIARVEPMYGFAKFSCVERIVVVEIEKFPNLSFNHDVRVHEFRSRGGKFREFGFVDLAIVVRICRVEIL